MAWHEYWSRGTAPAGDCRSATPLIGSVCAVGMVPMAPVILSLVSGVFAMNASVFQEQLDRNQEQRLSPAMPRQRLGQPPKRPLKVRAGAKSSSVK